MSQNTSTRNTISQNVSARNNSTGLSGAGWEEAGRGMGTKAYASPSRKPAEISSVSLYLCLGTPHSAAC